MICRNSNRYFAPLARQLPSIVQIRFASLPRILTLISTFAQPQPPKCTFPAPCGANPGGLALEMGQADLLSLFRQCTGFGAI